MTDTSSTRYCLLIILVLASFLWAPEFRSLFCSAPFDNSEPLHFRVLQTIYKKLTGERMQSSAEVKFAAQASAHNLGDFCQLLSDPYSFHAVYFLGSHGSACRWKQGISFSTFVADAVDSQAYMLPTG